MLQKIFNMKVNAKMRFITAIIMLWSVLLFAAIVIRNKIHTSSMETRFNSSDITDEKSIFNAFENQNNTSGSKTFTQRNYTVLSVTVPNYLNDTIFIDKDGVSDQTPAAWSYLFLLPLTVASWKRLNRTSIVLIVLDLEQICPHAKELFLHVRKTLKVLGAKIVIFNVPSNLMVRLSQLLRIIPATFNIFGERDFILTSDADLWPLNNTGLYEVQANKTVKVYNSECCGDFQYYKVPQTMYPMSHIEMPAAIWNAMIKDDTKFTEKDIKDIQNIYFNENNPRKKLNPTDNYEKNFSYINYDKIEKFMESIEKYAGGLAGFVKGDIYKKAVHGGRLWFLDQNYISTRLFNYLQKHGKKEFQFHVPTCDRVETWTWEATIKNFQKNNCLYDAHVHKKKPFMQAVWNVLIQLPKLLYDESTIDFMQDYRNTFVQIYNFQNQ